MLSQTISLLSSSLAPGTKYNYQRAFQLYEKFCQQHQLIATTLYEDNLMIYTTQLSHTSASNIKLHISAVKHFSTLLGYASYIPPLPRLYLLLRAIKRTKQQTRKSKRLPITINKLHQLHSFLRNHNIASRTVLHVFFLYKKHEIWGQPQCFLKTS